MSWILPISVVIGFIAKHMVIRDLKRQVAELTAENDLLRRLTFGAMTPEQQEVMRNAVEQGRVRYWVQGKPYEGGAS